MWKIFGGVCGINGVKCVVGMSGDRVDGVEGWMDLGEGYVFCVVDKRC